MGDAAVRSRDVGALCMFRSHPNLCHAEYCLPEPESNHLRYPESGIPSATNQTTAFHSASMMTHSWHEGVPDADTRISTGMLFLLCPKVALPAWGATNDRAVCARRIVMVRNVTRTFIDAMAFCFAVWPVLREGGREKREGK